MDIITDPQFWGEAMLAAASRLAILAAVIWVARLALRPARTKRIATRTAASPQPRPARRDDGVRVGADGTPFRYIDLKRPPERKPEPVTTNTQAIDPLRRRLLDYLEQRETERTSA